MEHVSQIHPLQVKVTLDLLECLSPDNESKGKDTQRKQRRAKTLPIRDNNNEYPQHNSASEVEKVATNDKAKPMETNSSKLSAAAKAFSSGTLSMSRHLNPVSMTSIYDANVSQGMLVETVHPRFAARVPCGPRSPLYYIPNYTFRMKHGSTKCSTPDRERSGSGAPRIMNPHAPEFVPRSASQIESSDANSKAGVNKRNGFVRLLDFGLCSW